MELSLLAKGVADLDAKTRDLAFSRFEPNEATFQRMDTMQRAAFADVLGAKAFERSVLRANSFNRLSEAQQLAVWATLGRSGQEAALRYAGFEADLARGPAMERQQHFDRYMQERFAQN